MIYVSPGGGEEMTGLKGFPRAGLDAETHRES